MSDKQMEMMAREHDLSGFDPALAEEVVKAAAEGATKGYSKIEQGVVDGYKKMETGVVEGFGKVVDKCVEVLFTKEGETVEEAKARLNQNKK